jgi:hypothetical protein
MHLLTLESHPRWVDAMYELKHVVCIRFAGCSIHLQNACLCLLLVPRRRAKYELMHVLRTHLACYTRYKSICSSKAAHVF